MLVEINPEAAHRFTLDPEADAFAVKLLSLLKEALVCDAGNLPPDLRLVLGGWATVMPGRRPRALKARQERSLREHPVPVLILRGECDYCIWDILPQYRALFSLKSPFFNNYVG